MNAQQVHDMQTVAVMGALMVLVLVAGILRERRREILAAREADAVEARENFMIVSNIAGCVRDELRPCR